MTISWRRAVRALPVLAVSVSMIAAIGCGGGGVPSGQNSQASANAGAHTGVTAVGTTGGSGTSTGGTSTGGTSTGGTSTGGTSTGGTTSGGGTGTPLHAVAWNYNDMNPNAGAANEVWVLIDDPTGTLDPNSIVLQVNGAASSTAQAGPLSNNPGGGYIITDATVPAGGSQLVVQATDGSGNTVRSQTIVTKAEQTGGNGFAPVAGFSTNSPADGDGFPSGYGTGVSVADAVPFTWYGQSGAYASQVLFVWLTDASGYTAANAATFQPNYDYPMVVQVSGTTFTHTAGSSQGVTATFLDQALPAPTQPAGGPQTDPNGYLIVSYYQWQVIGLDASGWGISTTSDVQGQNSTNASSQAIASWPSFDTQ